MSKILVWVMTGIIIWVLLIFIGMKYFCSKYDGFPEGFFDSNVIARV